MAQPNFGSVLDKPASEIERPKPLPQGSYVTVISGLPRFDKSSKKQTEFAEFTHKVLSAGEDVDQDDLKAHGDYQGREIKNTFYLTEASAYRLKEFLINDLGIEEQESLRPMLDEVAGRQCIVHIKHTASDDGKSVYANIASTAPVE